LKVISGTTNRFIIVYQLYSMHNVQPWDILCEQLFLLLYSTRRTVIWCWAWPVSDSWVSCITHESDVQCICSISLTDSLNH